MRIEFSQLIFIVLNIIYITNTHSNDYSPPTMLCPSGYWPAKINLTGGPYQTDRTFELSFHQSNTEQSSSSSSPICQFCPNVGCFIVRLSSSSSASMETKKYSTGNSGKTTPIQPVSSSTSTSSMIMTTSTTTTTVNESDMNTVNMTGTNNNSNFNETMESMNSSSSSNSTLIRDDTTYLYMSCDHWNNLPSPTEIISYLDCVMIGTSNEQFYLFIYEPRFQAESLPPVDCVDADFLAWIKNDTELLGLELGFRMKTIPPFLLRYYQHIMQSTQYICLDGRSLINHSIQFEDTERFASNKLTQVVFRSLTGLKRERLPPKSIDNYHRTAFQSDELVESCPFIVQHKPANITPNSDCQFSPSALPTTSDKVSSHQALERCPFRRLTMMNTIQMKKLRNIKSQQHSMISGDDQSMMMIYLPPSVLSACLLIVVLLLTIGIIIAFCIINHEKLMLCKSRSRKRHEREAAAAQEEMDEKVAKEAALAAAAAAAVAGEGEGQQQQQQQVRHPIYARYGMIPPNMGGAFGAFAPTYQTMTMNINNTTNTNTMVRHNPTFNGPMQ